MTKKEFKQRRITIDNCQSFYWMRYEYDKIILFSNMIKTDKGVIEVWEPTEQDVDWCFTKDLGEFFIVPEMPRHFHGNVWFNPSVLILQKNKLIKTTVKGLYTYGGKREKVYHSWKDKIYYTTSKKFKQRYRNFES